MLFSDADEQAALLAQAFEDDDVIADFEAEKRAVEEAEQPKDIDLCLPGWGEWTGPGMSVSRKKKDRYGYGCQCGSVYSV